MKKRYILMAVTAALVFAVAAGGTMAAQRVSSETLALGLNASTLGIKWLGDNTTADSESKTIQVSETDIMPGDTYVFNGADENYTVQNVESVKNAGNTNALPAYVRVTVTKYWQSNEDSGEKEPSKDRNADSSLLTLKCDTANWFEPVNVFEGRTKSETQVFYYKTPLEPGDATTKLLQSLELSTAAGNDYTDRQICLKAEAEAVQYVKDDNELNKEAILSAWGVKAELSEDGSIISIEN